MSPRKWTAVVVTKGTKNTRPCSLRARYPNSHWNPSSLSPQIWPPGWLGIKINYFCLSVCLSLCLSVSLSLSLSLFHLCIRGFFNNMNKKCVICNIYIYIYHLDCLVNSWLCVHKIQDRHSNFCLLVTAEVVSSSEEVLGCRWVVLGRVSRMPPVCNKIKSPVCSKAHTQICCTMPDYGMRQHTFQDQDQWMWFYIALPCTFFERMGAAMFSLFIQLKKNGKNVAYKHWLTPLRVVLDTNKNITSTKDAHWFTATTYKFIEK